MAQTKNQREGLKWVKVARFLSLPFSPAGFRTYLAVQRFEDVPVDRLIADGIKGVLLDADGTLGTHHTRSFPEPVIAHIQKMLAKDLRVAVYTNASEDRFEQLKGVAVVTDVPPKPDRRGFEQAMRRFLQMEDPREVCMIGDNYLTDGGAVLAGMRFIHVQPVPGNENIFHRTTRALACLVARFYSRWGK